MDKLSFIASDDRQYNISRVLSLIKSDVVLMVKNAKNIVIKPSAMIGDLAIASTHVDALEALLTFISPYATQQIILADGSVKGNTLDAFKKYDYFKAQDRFDFAIVDLNQDEYVEVGDGFKTKIAKTIFSCDLLITLCPPRSDNITAYSGAVKNIFEGSCARKSNSFASKITGSLRRNYWPSDTTLENDFLTKGVQKIFSQMPPALAILDGYTTLQSHGSIYDGKIASSHWAIAATNPIIADYLACLILQIDIPKIEYLFQLLPDEINNQIVLGDDWHKHQQKIILPGVANKE